MTAVLSNGQTKWSLSRNEEGHREYTIEHQVIANKLDGPAIVMNCAGLPTVGSAWSFDNDSDAWAFCTPKMKVTPVVVEEPNTIWRVEQVFSTIPTKRCQDTDIEDPLDEPDRISGSFVKYTKEAIYDRNGDAITNSSFERFRGAVVERDFNRPTVRVEKTLSTLPLGTFSSLIDYVNDSTMWGLPARCVKLSNASWERLLYGVCNYYYVVTYEFDIDYESFDRHILDEGTKVLIDGGDPTDPRDFIVSKDLNDENTTVLLNGAGQKWDGAGSPGLITVEFYEEADLETLLDLPSSF